MKENRGPALKRHHILGRVSKINFDALVFSLLVIAVSARSYTTNAFTYGIFTVVSDVCIVATAALLPAGLLYRRSFDFHGCLTFAATFFLLGVVYLLGDPGYDKFPMFFAITIFAFGAAAFLRDPDEDGLYLKQKCFAWIIGAFLAVNLAFGDLLQNPLGLLENYQGITRLAGFAAIILAVQAMNARGFWPRTCLFAGFMLAALLCLGGGGRGELLAMVIVLVPLFLSRRGGILILAAAAGGLVLAWDMVAELRGIERLLYAVQNLDTGDRADLWLDSLTLMFEKPEVFLVGCGVNCFQSHYSYPYGNYPHNILIELFITVGFLPALVLYSGAVGRAIVNWLNVSSRTYIIYCCCLYAMLIGMKSGGMFTSWILIILMVITTVPARKTPQASMRAAAA